MLYQIADLIAAVPEAGGLPSRCRDYLYEGKDGADVIIRTDLYRRERYHPQANEASIAYMESAYQFYYELIKHNGFYLHSSAVAYEGRGYLFSGPCGTGKSTHTRLWRKGRDQHQHEGTAWRDLLFEAIQRESDSKTECFGGG